MRTKQDYYDVLGVGREAAQDDIKRAYKRLARRYHPDVNPEPEAEERFKELSEAYAVLGSPERRAQYDRFGFEVPQGTGFTGGFGFGADLEDLIASFFGAGRAQADADRGADLRYDLDITLAEVLSGVDRTVDVTKVDYCDSCGGSGAAEGTGMRVCPQCGGAGRLTRSQSTFFGQFTTSATCPACRGVGQFPEKPCSECRGEGRYPQSGTFTVSIPAGIDDGTRVRLRGQGEAGRHGGAPGDLFVVVHVQDDPRFMRRGTELATEVPVSFSQAALGDTVAVEVPDGDEVSVEIPAGTQSGDRLEVRGRGLPTLRNPRNRGALHVFVRVHTPTELSDEERRLFRQLAELRQEAPPHEGTRSFLQKVWGRLTGD